MNKSRVLVVDANPVTRELMVQYLDNLEVNYYAVISGEESIDLSEFFDLVLIDSDLPGISGFETATQIRQSEKEKGVRAVPLIATTIHDNRRECIAAGMNDHFLKPVAQGDLQKLLARWLLEQPQKLRLLG